MKTQFFDREDVANPANGSVITDPLQLEKILRSVRGRPPSIAELIGDNGFTLLFFLGASDGCVQFSPSNGDLPYLVAVLPERKDDDELMTFLMSGTATEIPKRYCVPYAMIVDIAVAFVQTGQRKPDVRWEEI